MTTIEVPGHCRLILRAEEGREEWLKARTYGIGGSEVAALVGASPYSTAFDVFKSKTGLPQEDISGPAVEWGHRLEEAVGRKAADELGLEIHPGGGLWQSITHPRAIVTPDYLVTEPGGRTAIGVIECKTAGSSDGWETGRAPLHYQIQVQWQLGILGLERGWLACLELGRARNFYLVEIHFDREWFAELVVAAEKFWLDHVETGEPPMFDYEHPRTAELLKQQFPKVVKPSVQLPPEAEEWAKQYREARAELERVNRKVTEARNRLVAALGDAGAGYIGSRRIASYHEIKSTRINAKRLRKEFPEVAEQVKEETTYRRLTLAD